MSKTLYLAVLIIVAGLIALLSLKSVTSATDMVTGKDEQTHETRTDAAKRAVDELNQKTQEDIDKYDIYFD